MAAHSPVDPAIRDRARGALVGLAIGDAVGTTVEFAAPGSFVPLTDLVGGGPFGLPAGSWTDDTSMALCLAESIVDRGGLDPADQMRRYRLWWREGRHSSTGRCFDIGATTTTQLRRFERTAVAIDPVIDEESAANGSLMRLAPVPIAWWADVEVAAERSGESSRPTHAARRPVDACRLMGAQVAALIGGTPWKDVTARTFWSGPELHPQVAAIAAGSFRRKEPPEIRGSGFCIDALEAALWAVDGATDLRSAVLRAANLGDDADTTAAIAGQLAGARWGLAGVPAAWRERLLWFERFVSLADALVGLGLSTGPLAVEPWAFDEALHAWWVEPGAVLAGEYPTDRAGAELRVEMLVDAGVRTFVDLTTPADGLTPYAGIVGDLALWRDLDLRHRSFPIPDLGVIDVEGFRRIVEAIRAETAEGRPVYVHCWGGVGRTGTVVGCLLAAEGSGVSADEVGAKVASLRSGTRKAHRPSPETEVQREFLARWLAG